MSEERQSDFLIGGRRFRRIEKGTVERDQYVMGRSHRAGILQMVLREGESPTDFTMRIMLEMMATGEACNIAAGLVVPVGREDQDWDLRVAEDTARFLKRLTSREDQQAINDLLLGLILDFIGSGHVSFWTTVASSPEAMTAQTR